MQEVAHTHESMVYVKILLPRKWENILIIFDFQKIQSNVSYYYIKW